MNRIQRSDHRGKGFAGSLKDLVCDWVDRDGFMGDSDVAHQVRHFGIGDLVSQSKPIDGSHRFDEPQRATISFVPLSPNPDGVRLVQQDAQDN